MCPLWTSTAGETPTNSAAIFVYACGTNMPTFTDVLTPVSSVLIKGELPDGHQDVFWTTGRHEAVYVPISHENVV